jgi:hypothetical protein
METRDAEEDDDEARRERDSGHRDRRGCRVRGHIEGMSVRVRVHAGRLQGWRGVAGEESGIVLLTAATEEGGAPRVQVCRRWHEMTMKECRGQDEGRVSRGEERRTGRRVRGQQRGQASGNGSNQEMKELVECGRRGE